jgi:hypothetical protein
MWLDARGLKDVLDDMLTFGQKGDVSACQRLADVARDARQNLECRFRHRLGYEGHQLRRDLGKYSKS